MQPIVRTLQTPLVGAGARVNPAYAPPLRLVLPFFVIGAFSLILCAFALFGLDIVNFSNQDLYFVAYVHLFLLGFVMMMIVGTLAQLLPVVLQSPHYKVELYAFIAPVLAVGTIFMVVGFAYDIELLPYGGAGILIGFYLFLYESSMSIAQSLKTNKLNFTKFCLILANIALSLGLIFGLIMAFNFVGFLNLDFGFLLGNHFIFIFAYLYLIIMGVSLVLIPMFWIANKLNLYFAKLALILFLAALISFNFTPYFLPLLCFSILAYIIQLFGVYKKRARKSRDLYFKETFFAMLSLLGLLLLGVTYIFYPLPSFLLAMVFLLAWGFLGFLVCAHLYKILPFLIWYKIYAPLVGKKHVPNFAQMVPKSSRFNFFFNLIGLVLGLIAIFIKNAVLFKIAAFFIIIAVLILIKNLLFIVNLKEDYVF